MRYRMHIEFLEAGANIQMLMVHIVAEDGREYYGYNADCKDVHIEADPGIDVRSRSLQEIGCDIEAFCDPQQYGKPEFLATTNSFILDSL